MRGRKPKVKPMTAKGGEKMKPMTGTVSRRLAKIPIDPKIHQILKKYADLKGYYLFRFAGDILMDYIKKNGIDKEIENSEAKKD